MLSSVRKVIQRQFLAILLDKFTSLSAERLVQGAVCSPWPVKSYIRWLRNRAGFTRFKILGPSPCTPKQTLTSLTSSGVIIPRYDKPNEAHHACENLTRAKLPQNGTNFEKGM